MAGYVVATDYDLMNSLILLGFIILLFIIILAENK